MAKTVLIADDDRAVLETAKRYLAANGFAVVVTDSGSEALLLARDARPDLIVLDCEMPGLDGRATCRRLRQDAALRGVPLLLISGRLVDDRDVVDGLDGGADDYLLKPFSLAVLRARIEALLRRARPNAPAAAGALKRDGLELDPAGRSARLRGEPLALTRKEYDLLLALVERTGRVLSVPYLIETVWGYDPAEYNDPSTVEVHISRLRKKLGPTLGKRIVNFAGHGYKFEPFSAR